MAYYMFVNHGWRPGQVDSLSFREKILLRQFALRELQSRQEVK